MITSEQTSLLSELRQIPIPEATFAELEARLQHRIHSMVLDAFNKSGLTQKELADRLGWDEARVSRCLGASSNWTLKTISALLAAIGVDLDDPGYTSFEELERRLTQSSSSIVVATAIDNRLDPSPKDVRPHSVFDMMGRTRPQSDWKILINSDARQHPQAVSPLKKFLAAENDRQDDAA